MGIKIAEISDVEEIYKIGKNNLPIYYFRRELKEEILNRDCFFIVSYKILNNNKRKITGYCYAKKRNNIRMHILSFAVDKKYRKKNYGTNMIDFLVKTVKQYGIKLISLFVKEDNDIAINFYKKNGFHYKKTIENYYGENDNGLVYIKNIE